MRSNDLNSYKRRWKLAGLFFGCVAGYVAAIADAAQVPGGGGAAAGATFEAFEQRLPPEHGLALGWGRGHVLSLAAALSEPGDGLGLRDAVKLSPEQEKSLKDAVAKHAQETIQPPQAPDPTAPDPEGPAFASLESLDAAGRAAFAEAKLSDQQKDVVFRALLALQGAEALRSVDLAPASLRLAPDREALIARHVKEQFFRAMPPPTEPAPAALAESATPEKRQNLRRAATKALDRAIWEQLSQEQRAELIEIASNLPTLKIPAPEPQRETAPLTAPATAKPNRPDPATPGDPIPAPETPAAPESPGLPPKPELPAPPR